MLFRLREKKIEAKTTRYVLRPLLMRLILTIICLVSASCLTLEMQITANAAGQLEVDLDYLLSPLYLQIYETELLADYLFLPSKTTELTEQVDRAGGTIIAIDSNDLSEGRRITCRINFPDARSFADFLDSGAVRIQQNQSSGSTQLIFETSGIIANRDWVTGDIRRYISSMFGSSLIKAQLLAPTTLTSGRLAIINGTLAVYETTVANYLFATAPDIIDLRW